MITGGGGSGSGSTGVAAALRRLPGRSWPLHATLQVTLRPPFPTASIV